MSTVPPTVGMVAKFFGTGKCDRIWYFDIVLALAAAPVHLPIEKRAPVRLQPA